MHTVECYCSSVCCNRSLLVDQLFGSTVREDLIFTPSAFHRAIVIRQYTERFI